MIASQATGIIQQFIVIFGIFRPPFEMVQWPRMEGQLAQGDNSMESAFVLAEKPLLEILTQVRNGLPAPMFEQVASALGLSTSTLAAKLGIAVAP